MSLETPIFNLFMIPWRVMDSSLRPEQEIALCTYGESVLDLIQAFTSIHYFPLHKRNFKEDLLPSMFKLSQATKETEILLTCLYEAKTTLI